MRLWTLICLGFATKVHGFSDGFFPESCKSMLPHHTARNGQPYTPQTNNPPFKVDYKRGREGEPITVFLQSTDSSKFIGFMLEARETGKLDTGRPVGRFILLEPSETQLLKCNDLADSAVSQTGNLGKTLVKVNWTADTADQDVTFRATFLQAYGTFWHRVDVNVTAPTTPAPPTTQSSIIMSTAKTVASTTPPTTTTSTQSTTKPTTVTSSRPTTQLTVTASTARPHNTTIKPAVARSTTVSANPADYIEVDWGSGIGLLKDKTYIKAATVLMNVDILLVAAKMELPNIVTTTLTNSRDARCVMKVSHICCSVFCAAVEISALILLLVGESLTVSVITLTSVAMAVNFIELITAAVCSRDGICGIVGKLNSAIHITITTAVVFVCLLEIEDCKEKRKDSWLLIVMIAYTTGIVVFVIWNYVFIVYLDPKLERQRFERPIRSTAWREQMTMKNLTAAEATITAVSAAFAVGLIAFTAAIVAGVFQKQQDCA